MDPDPIDILESGHLDLDDDVGIGEVCNIEAGSRWRRVLLVIKSAAPGALDT